MGHVLGRLNFYTLGMMSNWAVVVLGKWIITLWGCWWQWGIGIWDSDHCGAGPMNHWAVWKWSLGEQYDFGGATMLQ